MTSSESSDASPERAERSALFVDRDLRGARFVRCDLSRAVLRAVDVAGAEIDAPWLLDGESTLLVNGIDVTGFVDAELDRRLPGRALRRAEDPDGLRAAWAAVEEAWAGAVARAETMPEGTLDASVDGEWSFAQTVRHLVMATDTWVRGAVLGVERPWHPLGMPNAEYAADGHDPSVFAPGTPPWSEVLAARADRTALVRDLLGAASADELDATRANPWAPEYSETVRSCLHTVLEEEWEHLRYALRDLDVLDARAGESGSAG
ncbi:DinB family protein [Phycicoccus sonneratiae]|uniref:DinB family protein n=1 Tax=Phycicoccus sonneratiae TaxID=2807628 RepID=A0ABS2CN40_9MICO|nr:DinB family protein [Phycicoccus sonneraticus]MBM6400873.1 DinB family protein [Phycicoccus sonneraticus]